MAENIYIISGMSRTKQIKQSFLENSPAYVIGERAGKGLVDTALLVACPQERCQSLEEILKTENKNFSVVQGFKREGFPNFEITGVDKNSPLPFATKTEIFLCLSNDEINSYILPRVLVRYGIDDGKPVFSCDDLNDGDWINVYASVNSWGMLEVYAQIDGENCTQSQCYSIPLTQEEIQVLDKVFCEMLTSMKNESYQIYSFLCKLTENIALMTFEEDCMSYAESDATENIRLWALSERINFDILADFIIRHDRADKDKVIKELDTALKNEDDFESYLSGNTNLTGSELIEFQNSRDIPLVKDTCVVNLDNGKCYIFDRVKDIDWNKIYNENPADAFIVTVNAKGVVPNSNAPKFKDKQADMER